jgi:hypothetical protein
MSILSVKLVAASTVERIVLHALGEECGFCRLKSTPKAISFAFAF